MRHGAGRARLIQGALLVLLAVGSPSQAIAQWEVPTTPITDGEHAFADPQVAVDAEGNATIVYGNYTGPPIPADEHHGPYADYHLLTRDWPAAGDPSDPVTIAAANVVLGSARLAENRRGDAVVAWQTVDADTGSHVIQAATRTAGGAFGAPQTVSATGAGVPAVAIDATGEAVVVWAREVEEPGAIEASVTGADGRFPPTASTIARARFVFTPVVATDAAGEVVVAWEQSRVERISMRKPGGGFGRPRRISKSGAIAAPVLAMNAAGDTVAVWLRDVPAGPGETYPRVEGLVRRAGHGFPTRARALSAVGFFSAELHAAIDPRGNALAVWARTSRSNKESVETSYRPAGGGLGKARALPGHRDNVASALAMDDGGSAYLLLQQQISVGNTALDALIQPPGARFQTPFSLQAGNTDISSPQIVAAGNGHAVGIWTNVGPAPDYDRTVIASRYSAGAS